MADVSSWLQGEVNGGGKALFLLQQQHTSSHATVLKWFYFVSLFFVSEYKWVKWVKQKICLTSSCEYYFKHCYDHMAYSGATSLVGFSFFFCFFTNTLTKNATRKVFRLIFSLSEQVNNYIQQPL